MPCTYNNFKMIAPLASCIIFLNGGPYSRNIMTNAVITSSSIDGSCYKVFYSGSYYDVEVAYIQLIIDKDWMKQEGLSPTGDWTELGYDYNSYLQPVG
jgi:hypothetical protein